MNPLVNGFMIHVFKQFHVSKNLVLKKQLKYVSLSKI